MIAVSFEEMLYCNFSVYSMIILLITSLFLFITMKSLIVFECS